MSGKGAVPRVSVVIPSWNGQELLPLVLDSLRLQTFRSIEVVVVDNGSEDGSLALLERVYPEVRVIALGENRGFSAAVNAGIRGTCGEYVALVNNDVELEPGWLQAMVAALDRTPEAGFAASRILRYSDDRFIDSAGDVVGVHPRGRGQGELNGPRFDEPAWVASACAAAALYRRSMLEEIGPFNEDFFAYFEDVELGLRAQIAGYRCLYVPDAVARHVGSATSELISDFKAYHCLRNIFLLYFTTFPRRYMLRYLPRFLLGRLAFAVSEAGPRVALRAALAVGRRIPGMIRRRRAIFALRRVPDEELERLLERPRRLPWAVVRERVRRVVGRRRAAVRRGRGSGPGLAGEAGATRQRASGALT